jgi:hypothetical protein
MLQMLLQLLLVHLLLSGEWTKQSRPLPHRAAQLQTTKKRS